MQDTYRYKLEQRKNKIERKKKNARIIFWAIIIAIFSIIICYRYAIINIKFKEKEDLKDKLSQVQKQNERLQVDIEKQTNIQDIEAQAEQTLGMKKLDESQKVYINLDKKDYTKTSVSKNNTEKWYQKFLSKLKGDK